MAVLEIVANDAAETTALQKLAIETDRRAAKARQHAAIAQARARDDAARGDHEAEDIHLREAKAHASAANVTERTAALYRNRLRRLTRTGATTSQREADA